MAKTKKKGYEVVPKPKDFLTKHPKAKRVTLAKDDDGYFIYTHRARSRSYKSIMLIPKSAVESIESTG
jgi:hypothetical protein